MTSSPTTSRHLAGQQKQAWMAIQGLGFFLALPLLVRAGRFLIPIFPLGSFAVGVFLYLRAPALYVGFTWWMWFLGPLIRRIIDYQSGHLTPGPWLLTPLLVTFISVMTLVKHLPNTSRQGGLPFIMCFGSVFYAFCTGVLQNSVTGCVLNLLAWLTPLLFGFHLFVNWRDYPEYRKVIQSTFLWGTLVMGAYGIWQYLVAPEWERFFLREITATSFGKPEPLGIRVFSSLDSPQTFAAVMMAGIILLWTNPKILRNLSAGVGHLSFLLSMARSLWLSWILGMLIFVPSLKARFQMRLVVSVMVASLFIVPILSIEPFSTVIGDRLESLSNTKNDTSANDRAEGYSDLIGLAVTEFVGKGLGSNVESDSLGSKDSGILSMLFSLGWFGSIPYLTGMFLLFFKLFQDSKASLDPFVSAARAIALTTFAQMGLNVPMISSFGMVLWGFIGIGMSAHKYYLYQQTTQQERSYSNVVSLPDRKLQALNK